MWVLLYFTEICFCFLFFFNFSTTDQNLNYTYIFVWVYILLLVNDNWTDSVYSWSFFYSLWLKFQCQTHILVFFMLYLRNRGQLHGYFKSCCKENNSWNGAIFKILVKGEARFSYQICKISSASGGNAPWPPAGTSSLHPGDFQCFHNFSCLNLIQ